MGCQYEEDALKYAQSFIDNAMKPVVEGGAKTRTVVIPEVTWKADDGKVVTGPTPITIPHTHSDLTLL